MDIQIFSKGQPEENSVKKPTTNGSTRGLSNEFFFLIIVGSGSDLRHKQTKVEKDKISHSKDAHQWIFSLHKHVLQFPNKAYEQTYSLSRHLHEWIGVVRMWGVSLRVWNSSSSCIILDQVILYEYYP